MWPLQIFLGFLLLSWISWLAPLIWYNLRPYRKRRLTIGELMEGIAVMAVIFAVIAQSHASVDVWRLLPLFLIYTYPVVLLERHAPERWDFRLIVIWSVLFFLVGLVVPAVGASRDLP